MITEPVSPIATGLPVDSQKTRDEGPEFDFAHPEVAAREAELREAAAGLKAVCEKWSDPPSDKEGWERLRSDLEAVMPGFYARYDGYVTSVLRTGKTVPACTRGCSHCCSHYVESVEPYELLFLHGRLRGGPAYPSRVVAMHRRVALFGSLRRESDGELAEDRALYRYYLRNMPCPMLGADGACGAYASRPMSCRMFFSMSKPDLCKGRAVIDPANRNFLIELPEDIEADLARAGSALSGYGLSESLFAGLVEVNGAFGQFDAGT